MEWIILGLDIIHKPIHEVILGGVVKDDSISFRRSNVQPQSANIRWCDGVAFVFSTPDLTDEMKEKAVNGTLWWNYLNFTEYGEYTKTIKHPDSNIEVPLFDMSSNETIADVIKWVKEHHAWFW